MEDINLLKQDNEKLTERLNNAAKFFREQKAQIEALTKENDELKHDAESFNSLQESYENTIKSKDLAFKALQDTYNEVFAENVNIKKEIVNLKETININTTETKKITNDYENKITQLEEQLVNAEKTIENDKLDYNKLNKEHKALNDTYNKLNNEYSNIYTKYNDLEQERIKSEEQLNALNTLCIKFKEENIKLSENSKLLEDANKEITKLNEDLLESNKMRDAYLNEIKDKDNTLDECDKEIHRCDEEIKKLKEDIENGKETYNNLENQKLALENDLSKLEEEHHKLKDEYLNLMNEKDAYSNSDDALKEIMDVINKYGYEVNKEITPAKENIMKTRIGSDKEFGQNVGV